MFGDLRLKTIAVLASSGIWLLTFWNPSASIRTVSVPIEFQRVPTGMRIADQSAEQVEVEPRGNPWVVDSISPSSLLVRLDLSGLSYGVRKVPVSPSVFHLPLGMVVDRMRPSTVTVKLEKTP